MNDRDEGGGESAGEEKRRDDGVVDADARSLAPWSVQAALSWKSRGGVVSVGIGATAPNQPAPGQKGYV
jgi:hypothetical protein